jgi:hypothetical protein
VVGYGPAKVVIDECLGVERFIQALLPVAIYTPISAPRNEKTIPGLTPNMDEPELSISTCTSIVSQLLLEVGDVLHVYIYIDV